jgi:tRNA threonylcarbamoyladenosine biosynthesis protein TsaB
MRPLGDGGPRQAILAIDTATSRAVLALALPDGTPLGETTWIAGHRHGETLLPALERLLGETSVLRSDLVGIVVGTGPGTFTGLRVGIATAKGLAHGLGAPIVGVSTAVALLASAAPEPVSGRAGTPRTDDSSHADDPGAGEGAAGAEPALLLPAGPQDRVLVFRGVSTHLRSGTEPVLPMGTRLVAVDLDGRAPADASSRGDHALRGLGGALLALGGRRLAAGEADDLARLVPEYVTLPRGVTSETGEVAWSRDRP